VKRWLIAGSLALVSTAALADQGTGFYLGASGGNATYDISKGDLDDISFAAFADNGAIPLSPTSSFDDSDTAWSLIAGYRFSSFIAVEAGYLDLGSTKYRASGNVLLPGFGTFPSTVGIDLSAKGPIVAAQLGAPLGAKFDVHTQLGAFFSKTSFDIGVGLGTFNGGDTVSANSADLFAGLGLGYRFSDTLAASVDFTRFKDVGDEEKTGEGDITSFRVGLTYTFAQ
jgi:OOP family OmpA-OmpF porin